MNPPPQYEFCLVRLRSSTQKGGTLIVEAVTDYASHERLICDPDGYRPPPSALAAGDDGCTCTITASACCAQNPARP